MKLTDDSKHSIYMREARALYTVIATCSVIQSMGPPSES